jgi:hypothetical protein
MLPKLIHLSLSLSAIFNWIVIWQSMKILKAQGEHLDSLTKLVLMMADDHPRIKVISGNVVPFKK